MSSTKFASCFASNALSFKEGCSIGAVLVASVFEKNCGWKTFLAGGEIDIAFLA
jgi:hypothetical protein